MTRTPVLLCVLCACAEQNVVVQVGQTAGSASGSGAMTSGGNAGAGTPASATGLPRVTGAITVTNAEARLPRGREVYTATVAIDGQEIGHCAVEDVGDGACIPRQAIEPGSHALDVRIVCRYVETQSWVNCIETFSERIHVRPREHIVVRLAEALANPGKPDVYLDHEPAPSPSLPPCLAELEQLAYGPSCSADDLGYALQQAEAAAECATALDFDPGLSGIGQALVATAYQNHLSPYIARCFSLFALTSTSSARRVPESVKGGLWDWSRATLPEEPERSSAEAMLETLTAALRAAQPRVDFVTKLTNVYLDRAQAGPLLQDARQAPWSFDRETLDGLRNWAIVNGRIWDREYKEWLEVEAAKDASLHCGSTGGQRIAQTLLREDLTRGGWSLLRAMMERTPEREPLGYCSHVISPQVSGPVAVQERAEWFANFECSDHRHPSMRGRETRQMVHPSSGPNPLLGAPLSSRLIAEHPQCLARR